MRVVFAADHAGFELKEKIVPFVRKLGHEVEDLGADAFDPADDYPDYMAKAVKRVLENPDETVAIVLGGSGQGEAMVANRFPGIRAVVFNGQYQPPDGRAVPNEIVTAREHNDANVLSLGARFLNANEAKEAVRLWLATPFSGDERHVRRIQKIERYPN